MSQILINAYLSELDRIKRISGSLSEQVIREAFKDLLKAWSRQQGLVFLAEHGMASTQKTSIRPDGTILHDLRVPLGYWEAKDTADDLDTDPSAQKPWMALATSMLPDLHLVGAAAGTACLPLYRFTPSGERIDNITDWALNKFAAHYGKAAKITKDDIFHYVYGVLHDPVYRTTYAQNLKRELPRIPLYPDFRKWAVWGKQLMDLHIGYEGIEPWPVTRTDTPDTKASAAGVSPKVILKSDPDNGTITLDSETVISGIPKEAWNYRLGNRSGLDWILDQHKEKTPKDPTIREKFNTYRFADHREKVVGLIARVTRVSVETVEIVEAMKSAKREAV